MVLLMIKGDLFWKSEGGTIVKPFESKHIQPNGIDLRLGTALVNYNNLGKIDSKNNIPEGDVIFASADEGFVLEPYGFYLGTTYEIVNIPRNMVGRIEGRSSIGRLGVTMHVTAGFIDSGFNGCITLELANLTDNEIKIYPMQRVCQLVLETCDDISETYSGKYQKQYLPQPSKINLD